ncbi:aldehyde dehydrogenase [Microdochium trichocladiopsis]|uniref:aldehyde dehydrogenase (NAD(+)) n=1 Tax=Microdochium trichocladiopsis TaxID=1682393 RepID=A0A9P9BX22_9PEZI|nr:aldehyde dehydrogenase [Microdochium trichocladiopsis]KAH7041145.1 aldehyde dehydrogenase [Microdochium trichocladiopsis]
MASNGIPPVDFSKFFNVIDGKLESTEKTLRPLNPSTLEENPPVPLSTQQDVDRAVAAAKKAQEAWREVPWAERADILRKIGDAVAANLDELAKLVTKENGKPLMFAKIEMAAGADNFHKIANFTIPENVVDADPEHTVITRYTPIGVAVGIVPWNFPVALGTGKIAPALLTGNAIIIKPSPFTPYSALKIVEIAQPFLPPGVLQVLSGDDSLGPILTEHEGIDKISFTGSTATGKAVMRSASKTLKRVTLELGGNDPAIVCPDVDPAEVGPKLATFALLNSGQICVAIKRMYIHESVYDAVLKAMVDYVNTLKVGDGFEENVFLGPIANGPQFERVKNLLEDIQSTKLKIATGGTAAHNGSGKGYFVTPTIIDNPPEDSRIVADEPFAPIFPTLKWSDEADVIRRANDSIYGLGASVWTNDTTQAKRIASKLQAGNVWINEHANLSPTSAFGGHKHSGIGTEWGIEGVKGWCNTQTIYHKARP